MTTHFEGYHRVLVATDFSVDSEAAFRQALWLAKCSPTTITLAHALPDLRQVVHSSSIDAKLDLLQGEGELIEREVRRSSDARMRKMIDDAGASRLMMKCETLLGQPFVELIHAVQAEAYDLVLAGTRGLSAWKQFLVGSTAKRLVRKCPSNVWIVKPSHGAPPRAVLALTDFSEVSVKGVAHGLWIAQQANAELHLLHVLDSTPVLAEVISTHPRGGTLNEDLLNEARQRLESLVESLASNRQRIHVHTAWGIPWMEVEHVMEQVQADLIVMGTVGRGGIKGVLMGNTAEKVLDACDCSILTVKPDDFVSPIQPAAWPLHPEV